MTNTVQGMVSSAFCFPPFYEVNSNGWLTGLEAMPFRKHHRGATGAMPGDVQIMTNLNSSARNGLLSCKVDPLTNKINVP